LQGLCEKVHRLVLVKFHYFDFCGFVVQQLVEAENTCNLICSRGCYEISEKSATNFSVIPSFDGTN